MNRSMAATELRRRQIMRVAIAEGIVTDHISDGVCEQLLSEGWLERAVKLPRRPHVLRMSAYLPTEKALQHWDKEDKT